MIPVLLIAMLGLLAAIIAVLVGIHRMMVR